MQVSDLKKNLNIVNSISEEASNLTLFILFCLYKLPSFTENHFYQVRNSVKLKRIMQTILSLGNALNQGTARGEWKCHLFLVHDISKILLFLRIKNCRFEC